MIHIPKYQLMGFKTGLTLCGKRVKAKFLSEDGHNECPICAEIDKLRVESLKIMREFAANNHQLTPDMKVRLEANNNRMVELGFYERLERS